MLILVIETSCDETAAAVIKDGEVILSNVVATSLKEHIKFGGVIPEIASRRQMEFINAVVQEALTKAGLKLKDVDKIAVTQSPGLIGSLLVGISYARALSFATAKPLIEIDHIKAHLYASFLRFADKYPVAPSPQLPAIGLVVSGGHSSLYHIKSFTEFRLLGQTRDDAAGEAFDKVARILDLGYPGGPIIDRLAKGGFNREVSFAAAQMENSFDFSFSGVKTAVLYYRRKNPSADVRKIAYSFQDSVVSILIKKALEACRKKKIRTLLLGGGVAANSALRERLTQQAQEKDVQVFFPPMSLCLDNAAMIAGLAFHTRARTAQTVRKR